MTVFAHTREKLVRLVRQEWKPTLRLAVPVVVAEIGWTAMGTVDTMMVGRLSAEAIGAVSLGTAAFLVVTIFGMGLLLGLDTLISQAFGAGRLDECNRSLFHGIYASLLLAVPLTALLLQAGPVLERMGLNPDVVALTIPYLRPVVYGLLPLLFYASLRRYLQATGHVLSVMMVLVSANLVNVVANWMLIFGNLGAPALGIEGAGWATFISRCYLAVGMLGCILYYNRRQGYGLFTTRLGFEWQRLRRLVGLGLPAALQITMEFGVFAAATTLAAYLDAASLAAHQIALTIASTTFMVPLGLSSAAAVRVGRSVGGGDPRAARRGGWMAILLGVGFMSLSMLAFLLFPELIIRAFTSDPEVIAVGVSLLYVAAFFQLFDGLQAVTTGALRGLGETRLPMLAAFFGFWVAGLPVGYFLCFPAGRGVWGLWIGLSLGLIVVGALLLVVWSKRSKSLTLA